MIICDKPCFCYAPPSKTVTTSIEKMLSSLGYAIKHYGSNRHSAIKSPLDKSCFHFISIRNPYERMISLYRYYKERPKDHNPEQTISFEVFVREFIVKDPKGHVVLLPQYGYLSFMPSLDLVIRYETFEDDVKKIPFLSKDMEVFDLNKSKYPKPWKSFYTDELAKLIYDKYLLDFTLLGYKKESYL